jgi:hypothetical protein
MSILQPTRLTSPEQLPPLGAGRDAQPEDRLWRELLLSLWGLPVSEPMWPRFCSMHVYDQPSSRNWPALAAAAWIAAEPDRIIDGRSAPQWWQDWSGWQLSGKSSPHRVRDTAAVADWWERWSADPLRRDSAPAALRLFGSDEVLSNTYDGMTLGAALTALVVARRRQDLDTQAALSSALAVWVAANALAATAPADTLSIYNLEGTITPRLPQGANLPTLVGIGARSTPNHAAADPRALLLAELIDWPDAQHPWPLRDPWEYWFLQIAALCDNDFGLAPDLAADARAVISTSDPDAMDRLATSLAGTRWVGFEIRRWPDLVVGIMPECRNGNTAWVPASAARPHGRTELWFPWPKAKPGNLSSGKAWIDDSGTLRVASGFGDLPGLPLPAEPPLRHWIFAPEGFQPAGAAPAGGAGIQGGSPSMETRLNTLEKEVRELREAVARLQQG